MAKLARMIVALQSQAAKVGTAPQLPNSAIVDGTLDLVTLVDTGETDADGDPIFAEVVQAQLGTQEDGSQTLVVLDGPDPAAPDGMTALAGPGTITVAWDGSFVDDAPATLDHDHIAVHVAKVADVNAETVVMPSPETLAGTIRPLEGGWVTVAAEYVPYYVTLVAVTQAGKWGPVGTVATVTPRRLVETDMNVVLPGDVAFSDINNLIPDGSFEQALLRDARAAAATGGWTWDNAAASVGSWSARCNADGVLPLHGVAQAAPFVAGGKLYVSAKVRGTPDATGVVKVQLVTSAGTVDVLTRDAAAETPTGGWELAEGVVAVGDLAQCSLQVVVAGQTAGSWWVDAVRCLQVVPSALIEDAAITNAKIAAAAIEDANIASLNVAKLVGDTITGQFLIAGRFETATVGGPKMDAAGIRVYDLAGDLQTALNSDGTSTFRGQVEASAIEVLGKLKFHGPDSEVAAGARLNITGGVTAPTTSPNVYAEWPTVTLTGVPKTTITGVTRDPANGDWIVASMNSTGAPTATRHAAATGAKTATLGTFPTPTGYQYPANGGIAFVGGVAWVPLFVNEYSDLTYWTTTQIAATDGTRKTVLAKSASYMWSEGQRIAIGYASPTQVAVALYDFTRTSSKSRLLLFTPSTAAASGNVACGDVGMAAPPVAYGTFDFGAARFVLDATDTVKTYLTTGAAESANNFRTGRSVQSVGVGWYGGAFWTAGTDRKCYVYDGPKVGAVGAEFAATWYDSKSAGTGVHETPLGPSGWSETGVSRARLRVHPPLLTLTDGDDGVDSVRIYARVGSDMRLQGTLSAAGATLLITGALATGGAIHGAVADFPATSPGFIENSTGDIVLPGNGMARLRGLNVPIPLTSENINALPHGIYEPGVSFITTGRGYPWNGVMGKLEVLGWVTGSGDVQRFTTMEAAPRVVVRSGGPGAWSPWTYMAGPPEKSSLTIVTATSLYAPTAYRRGGWVNLDGAISQGSVPNAAWTRVCTLPTGFRPSKYQYYPSSLPSTSITNGLRVQTSGAIEAYFGAATAGAMPLTGIQFAVS